MCWPCGLCEGWGCWTEPACLVDTAATAAAAAAAAAATAGIGAAGATAAPAFPILCALAPALTSAPCAAVGSGSPAERAGGAGILCRTGPRLPDSVPPLHWVPVSCQIAPLLQSEEVGPAFFASLAHVRQIHANCKALLRTHHQRAGGHPVSDVACLRSRCPACVPSCTAAGMAMQRKACRRGATARLGTLTPADLQACS